MRIRFITDNASPLVFDDGEERADVTLVCFYKEEVSYEKELKGETRFFERLARYSKASKSVVVCGCVTDTKGLRRKSVAVAERGRLTGVADMLNAVDGEYVSGAALRVYETGAGRMGVLVANDLRFPELIKSLAECGSDFIVCALDTMEGIETVLLRACAYCYGVPIYFCAQGYCMIADVSGEIVFASPNNDSITEFVPRKEYHLVETRRRGFYKAR